MEVTMITINKQLLKRIIYSSLLLMTLTAGQAQEYKDKEHSYSPYRMSPTRLEELRKREKQPTISISELLRDDYGNPNGPTAKEAEKERDK